MPRDESFIILITVLFALIGDLKKYDLVSKETFQKYTNGIVSNCFLLALLSLELMIKTFFDRSSSCGGDSSARILAWRNSRIAMNSTMTKNIGHGTGALN